MAEGGDMWKEEERLKIPVQSSERDQKEARVKKIQENKRVMAEVRKSFKERKEAAGRQHAETEVLRSGTSLAVPRDVKILNICKVVKDRTPAHHFIRKARVLIVVNADFKRNKCRDEAKHDYEMLRRSMIENYGYEDFMEEAIKKPEEYFTDLEEDKVKEFQGLKYDSIKDYSWTKSQITTIVKALAKQPYNGDAFFIFLDSHGGLQDGKEAVIDTDDQCVFVKELIDILNNECHKDNKNIPKFMCIQACRGKKTIPTANIFVEQAEPGNRIQLPTTNLQQLSLQGVQTLPTSPLYHESGSGDVRREQVQPAELEENHFVPVSCPSGFVVMYAAPKGCKSGRHPKGIIDPTGIIDEGSYFVQLFCIHLERCLAEIDTRDGVALLPLLIGVNHAATLYYEECPELMHCLSQLPVLCKNDEKC